MDVNFTCSSCGRILALEEKCLGRKVQCPFCNSVFVFTSDAIKRNPPKHNNVTNAATVSSQQSPSGFAAKPIGFWARVVAAIIDAIVTFTASVIVAFMAGLFMAVVGGNAELIGQLIGIATSWLYCSLMESSDVQATLGKLVIGAKVIDANGEKLTFGRATGRHFAKFISTLLLLVGYVMVAFDDRKRGLHDMLAGTFVISRH